METWLLIWNSCPLWISARRGVMTSSDGIRLYLTRRSEARARGLGIFWFRLAARELLRNFSTQAHWHQTCETYLWVILGLSIHEVRCDQQHSGSFKYYVINVPSPPHPLPSSLHTESEFSEFIFNAVAKSTSPLPVSRLPVDKTRNQFIRFPLADSEFLAFSILFLFPLVMMMTWYSNGPIAKSPKHSSEKCCDQKY